MLSKFRGKFKGGRKTRRGKKRGRKRVKSEEHVDDNYSIFLNSVCPLLLEYSQICFYHFL